MADLKSTQGDTSVQSKQLLPTGIRRQTQKGCDVLILGFLLSRKEQRMWGMNLREKSKTNLQSEHNLCVQEQSL